MREDDLPAVLAVQADCYPAPLQEPADVVLARLRAAPQTVLVAFDDAGVCGYLFAYPSLLGKVTPLGGVFVPAPAPDTLYLHDLAVARRALGQGVGRALVARMLAIGRGQGLAHSALVSVQDSLRFWEGCGYRETACAADDLATYPDTTMYMVRRY